jgi:hypothetical protein
VLTVSDGFVVQSLPRGVDAADERLISEPAPMSAAIWVVVALCIAAIIIGLIFLIVRTYQLFFTDSANVSVSESSNDDSLANVW